ncbi:P2Y purinoceptor 14-like [Scomber scombrus]|uniref:P2Y purinoceptor 14-like n=1 Tax=Scomber scombrus TaxID=13677 RepID=A0AAV1P239_SCOSC
MEKDACRNKTSCFAYCVISMASWNNESEEQELTVCPKRLDNRFETWVPPLTIKTEGLVHPICIMRGEKMIKEMTDAQNAMRDALRKLTANSSNPVIGFKTPNGTQYKWSSRFKNQTNQTPIVKRTGIWLARGVTEKGVQAEFKRLKIPQNLRYPVQPWVSLSTSKKAAIHCKDIAVDNNALKTWHDGKYVMQYKIPSLANGTRPLADVFWLCDDDPQISMWQNNPYPTAGPSQDFQAPQPLPSLGPQEEAYGPIHRGYYLPYPQRPETPSVIESNPSIRGPWPPIPGQEEPGPSGRTSYQQTPPMPQQTWHYDQTIQEWAIRRDVSTAPIFQLLQPRTDDQKGDFVDIIRGDIGPPSRESSIAMRTLLNEATLELDRERQIMDAFTGHPGGQTPAGVEPQSQPTGGEVTTGTAQLGESIGGPYREGVGDDSDSDGNYSPTSPRPVPGEESLGAYQPMMEAGDRDSNIPGPSNQPPPPQLKRMRVQSTSPLRRQSPKPKSTRISSWIDEKKVGALPRSKFILMTQQAPEGVANQLRKVRMKQKKKQQQQEKKDAAALVAQLRREKQDIERAAEMSKGKLEKAIELLEEGKRREAEIFQAEITQMRNTFQRQIGCLIGHVDRIRSQLTLANRVVERIRTLRTGVEANGWDIPSIIGVDTPTSALDVILPCGDKEEYPCAVCAGSSTDSGMLVKATSQKN